MDTQIRPRTRTGPRRRMAPLPGTPVAEATRAPAQGAPRQRTRTAPAARRQEASFAVAIPEPFNPYLLPTDRSAQGWARWAGQAAVLSVIATLIWDRGTAIRPELKNGKLAAPAQWMSAMILGLGSFALAPRFGLPWGFLPLAFCFVVLTRRALAAEGAALTLEAATDRLFRKLFLAGLGVGVRWSSTVLSAWATTMTASLMSNPLSQLAGGTAVADMKEQTASISEGILFYGTGISGVLFFITVLWWSAAASRTAMDAAAEQRRVEEKTLAVAEETVDV